MPLLIPTCSLESPGTYIINRKVTLLAFNTSLYLNYRHRCNMKLFTPLVSILLILSHSSANPLDRLTALQPTVDPTAIRLSPTGGGTYPRLANVQGAILAAYTAFDGDTHVLTISRSTDGGKSFSAWGTVASGTGDLDNPDLIQLSNGNIVCTFRNHDINNSGNHTFYRITASLSTDGGKSWTYLSQVDQRAAAGRNGLWASLLLALGDRI